MVGGFEGRPRRRNRFSACGPRQSVGGTDIVLPGRYGASAPVEFWHSSSSGMAPSYRDFNFYASIISLAVIAYAVARHFDGGLGGHRPLRRNWPFVHFFIPGSKAMSRGAPDALRLRLSCCRRLPWFAPKAAAGANLACATAPSGAQRHRVS